MRGDNLLTGLIATICLPIVTFILLRFLNGLLVDFFTEGFVGFRLQFIGLLAILSNVIPVHFFYRQRRDRAAKAAMGCTILLVFVWMVYFGVGVF